VCVCVCVLVCALSLIYAGVEGSGLTLDLIYNPLGAFLPPEQTALEVCPPPALTPQYPETLHPNTLRPYTPIP
jgi:hypothetical protein